MAKKKNRGVRGSHTKLEAALAASDLSKKNQTALAEAIADREELDAAPKDLISKLFRELPVDPHTIERVARILRVDALSLYRTDDEPELPFANGNSNGNGNGQTRPVAPGGPAQRLRNMALLFVIALVIGVGISEILKPFTPANSCPDGLVGSGFTTPGKSLGIVISRFTGDERNEIQIMLARFFAMDGKLAKSIEVFTSCRRYDNSQALPFKQAMQQTRKEAIRDLDAVDAQIYIWGERYGNRLNLHFITRQNNEEATTLRIKEKLVQVRENSFTLPVTMSADRPFPPYVKQIAFDMMYAETGIRAALKKKLYNSFQNQSNWLEESIVTGRHLLRTISPKTHQHFYILTGGQLCYQYRLLGDINSDEKQYKLGEEICRQVASHMSKKDSPYDWGTLQINLASVITRQQLFVKTAAERREILNRARKILKKADGAFDPVQFPDNYSAYYKNYAGILLRLAEITEREKSIHYLKKAILYTEKSLETLDPDKQPYDYAMSKQNLCVIRYRLGEKIKEGSFVEKAIKNCREAVTILSLKKYPQAWGMIQNNLANAIATLANINKSRSLFDQAIIAYNVAQQKSYTYADFPANWAEVEVNKAALFCNIALFANDPSFLSRTKEHGQAAFRVFTEKGIKPYADIADNLLEFVRSCDPENIKNCKCPE